MALAPSATAEQLTVGGEAIAAKLNELTGFNFEVIIPNSYTALIEAMASGNAHVGLMPTFAYLLGKTGWSMEVQLVVVRNGSDFYGAQFVAHADMGSHHTLMPKPTPTQLMQLPLLLSLTANAPASQIPCQFLVISSLVVSLKNRASITRLRLLFRVIPQLFMLCMRVSAGICDFGATYIDARTSDRSMLM